MLASRLKGASSPLNLNTDAHRYPPGPEAQMPSPRPMGGGSEDPQVASGTHLEAEHARSHCLLGRGGPV